MSTSDTAVTDRARELHKQSVVVDGMNNAGLTGEYFDQILAGGVTAAMVPVSITDPLVVAVDKILALRELVEEHANRVLIVESVADIHQAKQESKLALILALEDTRPLEKDLRKIQMFRDLGVRRMQLVYTTLNDVGSGAGDRVDSGLSRFGIEVVGEMERRGMLIDLSHASPTTHADALAVVEKPCVWSHTNVQGVFDHANNLSDEQLDAVARNGGVVGISGVPFYTGPADATIEHVIDHIDYVKTRIGVDHVGVGLAIFENHPLSFYDRFASLPVDVYGQAPWTWPDGISTISEFPSITEALVRRGYSDAEIESILGGNFLRVLGSAWSF